MSRTVSNRRRFTLLTKKAKYATIEDYLTPLIMQIPLKKFRQKVGAFVAAKPWPTFVILLVILFGIIFTSYTLRAPEALPESTPLAPKKVSILSPDTGSLAITVPAQVKKDSIIRITALTPGIVSGIFVRPGQIVPQGRALFTLTNDYGSGASSIEKEIAKNDAALAEQVATLDKKIQTLDERRIKHDNTLSGSAEDVELATLRKDREVRRYTLTSSRLNLALALRNDAVLQPKSSLPGTITNIAVRRGQFVNQGDILATLNASGAEATLEASLSSDTAWLLDPTKNAELILPTGNIPLTLIYLANQESEDGLYKAIFGLPAESAQKLVDGHYTDIRIALESHDGSILLPLETISQDTKSAWVMVEENGIAHPHTVTLGNIFGNYIEVTSGITKDTHVILSRGIIEGEAVTTE